MGRQRLQNEKEKSGKSKVKKGPALGDMTARYTVYIPSLKDPQRRGLNDRRFEMMSAVTRVPPLAMVARCYLET